MSQTRASERQHPLTLGFADDRLERAYLEERFRKTLRQSRVALALGAFLYALFGGLDYWIAPDRLPELWVLRFAIMVPAFWLLWGLSFTSHFLKSCQMYMGAATILAGCGICGLLVLTEEMASILFSISMILVIIWSFNFSGLRFINALLSCAIALVIFEYVALFISHHPLSIFINNNFYIFSSLVISMFSGYTIENYSRQDFLNNRIIEAERAANEKLLLNILPKTIAERLKQDSQTIADCYESAAILFADIVGFTQLSERLKATELVGLLNDIFSKFDELTDRHQLEKIKTIGDAYMVAGGLPTPREDFDPAAAIADLALDMRKSVACFRQEKNYPLDIRIGMHAGPAIAGVIGTKKFIYDIWGDSVNTASRMESHSLPDRIQTTEATYQLLKDRYLFEERGTIEIKGKGKMKTYFLTGKHGGDLACLQQD